MNYIAQDSLKLILILLQPPEYWNYRGVLPHKFKNETFCTQKWRCLPILETGIVWNRNNIHTSPPQSPVARALDEQRRKLASVWTDP